MGRFSDFHQRSIQDRDAFWAEQAQQIEWHKAPQEICDYSNPPFAKWFNVGETFFQFFAWNRARIFVWQVDICR